MNLTDLIKVAEAPAQGVTPRAPAVSAPLRISAEETAAAAEDDRFHRFRLIRWWDQAKLSRAKVLVEGAPDFVELLIEDNGKGFDASDTSAKAQTGIGILGMKERAEVMGAEILIDSEAGHGTRVNVRVPTVRKAGRLS